MRTWKKKDQRWGLLLVSGQRIVLLRSGMLKKYLIFLSKILKIKNLSA
jgi:hypothetical protein